MTTDLTTLAAGVTRTESALTFSPTLSFEDWALVGEWLRTVDAAVQWWIGDWVNFGEGAYGERMAQAVDATGWQVSRLLQAAWVAKQIPPEERVPGLTWSHHRTVAAIEGPKRAELLAGALVGGWSVAGLREMAASEDMTMARVTVVDVTCTTEAQAEKVVSAVIKLGVPSDAIRTRQKAVK